MILTDREIKLAIEKQLIVIEPRPKPEAFSSTAVDLTLDPNITEFKREVGGIEPVIDPALRISRRKQSCAKSPKIRRLARKAICLNLIDWCSLGQPNTSISSHITELPRAWRGKARWPAWVSASTLPLLRFMPDSMGRSGLRWSITAGSRYGCAEVCAFAN